MKKVDLKNEIKILLLELEELKLPKKLLMKFLRISLLGFMIFIIIQS